MFTANKADRVTAKKGFCWLSSVEPRLWLGVARTTTLLLRARWGAWMRVVVEHVLYCSACIVSVLVNFIDGIQIVIQYQCAAQRPRFHWDRKIDLADREIKSCFHWAVREIPRRTGKMNFPVDEFPGPGNLYADPPPCI